MRANRRRLVVGLAIAVGILALLAGAAVYLSGREPPIPRRDVDWSAHQRGPVDARRVYWIGHSLMSSRDSHAEDAPNIIEVVGELAAREGLSYDAFDHTFWGAPLAMNWTGAARSYDRSDPAALERREELETNAAAYDALVMTEAVPVGPTSRAEAGSHYAQRFYCTLIRANPDADVYVYETWTDYDAPGPWMDRIAADRAHWERIADEAAAARVPEPGRLSRLAAWIAPPDPECEGPPIFIVPVGSVLRRLGEAIEAEPEAWRTSDGDPLTIAHLLANPHMASGALRHPDADPDVIHPSVLGTHVAALVHFATLYRRPPGGDHAALDAATNERLRELVWEVVRADPRAGVR